MEALYSGGYRHIDFTDTECLEGERGYEKRPVISGPVHGPGGRESDAAIGG